MRRAALVVALIVTGALDRAGDAVAQPAMTPIEPAVPPAAPAAPAPSGKQRSEGTALGLSLGATLAAWGGLWVGSMRIDDGERNEPLAQVSLIATVVAPTLGHWYSGSYVSRGLVIRAAALGAMSVGLLKISAGAGGETLLWGGLALHVAGTIDDLVTAPGKARRYNRRLGGAVLAPVAAPGGAGVSLAGTF